MTAIVEPTSLALAISVDRAGGQMENGRRPTLLTAAQGHHGLEQSGVIDSEVLAHAGEIFNPPPLAFPGQLALRRAVVYRWPAGPFPMCGPRSPGPRQQPSPPGPVAPPPFPGIVAR